MRNLHMDPALHNRARMVNFNPYARQDALFLAKVVQVHPDRGTVDVALDPEGGQGGFYNNVPILSWSYASKTGQTYLPGNITLAAPLPSAHGTYDQPIPSGGQDVWCVCAHLGNRAQRPVCIGFMSPPVSQVHTTDAGYEVKVHESGVFTVIAPDGQVTVGYPDGSTVVVGASTTPADMTAQNAAWSPATTGTAYNVALNFKGNVSLTTAGSVTVNAPTVTLGDTAGAGAGVARVGDSVSVDVSGTTYTGTITSASAKVFSG